MELGEPPAAPPQRKRRRKAAAEGDAIRAAAEEAAAAGEKRLEAREHDLDIARQMEAAKARLEVEQAELVVSMRRVQTVFLAGLRFHTVLLQTRGSASAWL